MTLATALERTTLLCRDFLSPQEVADDELAETLGGVRVIIVSDERNLATAAGQTALVSLVCQLMGYGARLELAIPNHPIVGYQPPLRGDRIRDAVEDLMRDHIPALKLRECIVVETSLVLGNSPVRSTSGPTWRVGGTAWAGQLAPRNASTRDWNSDIPFGALLAATAAAAEPFKAALRHLMAKRNVQRNYVELLPARHVNVGFAVPPEPRYNCKQRIDIISGGAITNALLFALLRMPSLQALVRVFEPETFELTNLNRYALARLSDVGLSKLAVLQAWECDALRIIGVPRRYAEGELEPNERSLAPYVVVGADHIPTRWFAQQQRPEWLAVGATSHFLAMSSEHAKGEPCAGCVHPADDAVEAPIATVSFVSFAAGITLAARVVALASGARYSRGRQVLEVHPLRLDGPYGLRWYQPPLSRNCPVGCQATLS